RPPLDTLSPLSLHDALPILRFHYHVSFEARTRRHEFIDSTSEAAKPRQQKNSCACQRAAVFIHRDDSLYGVRRCIDDSHAGWGRDRKSTRLNSSHEWISYAV